MLTFCVWRHEPKWARNTLILFEIIFTFLDRFKISYNSGYIIVMWHLNYSGDQNNMKMKNCCWRYQN